MTVFDALARPGSEENLPLGHPNFTLIKGDIIDRSGLMSAMADHDVVFHCAAVLGVRSVTAAPLQTIKVNLTGSMNVLDCAGDLASLQRIVCFSTSEVFGRWAVGVTESSDAVIPSADEARWSYAASKLAEEHYAFALHREAGVPVTIIRPFNIYGPGQTGEGAVANFVRAAIEDRPLTVRAPGTQLRAWCFVDDLVDGVIKAAFHPTAVGQSFNIGNPWSVATTLDLAKRVIDRAGASSSIQLIDPTPDVEARTPSIQKAREMLGFEPSVSLDKGIDLTIAWFRKILG